MTREETIKLMMMIQATYPNYKPQDKTVTIDTWLTMLEDFDFDVIQIAFKAYVRSDTSGFAPSPGQLIDKIQLIASPQELNEQEAWSLVANALRNSTYNSVEEFTKFPPLVQRAVGQSSQLRYWAMDENFNEEVAKASFQRSYRYELEMSKQTQKLSADVQAMIANVNQTSYKRFLATKNEQTINLPTQSEKSLYDAFKDVTEGNAIDGQVEEKLKMLKMELGGEK